jgi:hypothetical protein
MREGVQLTLKIASSRAAWTRALRKTPFTTGPVPPSIFTRVPGGEAETDLRDVTQMFRSSVRSCFAPPLVFQPLAFPGRGVQRGGGIVPSRDALKSRSPCTASPKTRPSWPVVGFWEVCVAGLGSVVRDCHDIRPFPARERQE